MGQGAGSDPEAEGRFTQAGQWPRRADPAIPPGALARTNAAAIAPTSLPFLPRRGASPTKGAG